MTARKVCPQCGESGTLRKILYGLPMREPDPSKFMLGGCATPLGPKYDTGCINCRWEGFSTLTKQQAAENLEKAIIEFANRPISQEEVDRLAAIPRRSKHREVRLPKKVIRVKRT